MANFMFRITLPPRPWPFSWGPWGTSREFVSFEMNDGQVLIWQRDRKGEDGMAADPMEITCKTGKSSCTIKVENGTRSLVRRTRL